MKSNQWVGALVALTLLAGTAWFAWHNYQKSPIDLAQTVDHADDVNATTETGASSVVLGRAKLAAAEVRTEPVRVGDLQTTRTLSARFAYDDTRHVALRTPTDGVLESVLVMPGDAVSKGQPVAVLRSPSIGVARSEVLSRQTALELVSKAHRWESDIHDGVKELVARIRKGESVDSIGKQMEDKTTGEFGGGLLNAYSQLELASSISSSIANTGNSGAISGWVVRERRSQQQQAESTLEALIQQSVFQTQQALATACGNVAQAERELRIARLTLATLVGVTPTSSDGLDVSRDDPDVSRLTIISPIDGTVEQRYFSATERVKASDDVLVIADTSRLWVEADIRGRDWDSVNAKAGDVVSVVIPSIDGLPHTAEVYFVGRQVDAASGAIPLIASIDNVAGLYRPGLFARVLIPADQLMDVITVPDSAIVDLDGQDSVFVQRDGGFHPTAVNVGVRGDGVVEIRHGLSEGQQVVVGGAFTLKSELLLEGEE